MRHGDGGGRRKQPLPVLALQRRSRVDETVERLAASGATFVTASTEYGEYCVTMLDP